MKFAVGFASLVLAASIFLSAAADTSSPVEKVVNLLTELKGRITVDSKSEQQVYDKYACWCEETTARRAAGIESAKDALRALGQDILSLKGKAATLAAEIKQLLADVKANEEAQAEATAIRQKENAAYAAESAEMKQALAALEKAVTLLRGATSNPAALLQRRSSAKEVARSLQAVVAALPVDDGSASHVTSKLPLTALSQLRRVSSELAASDGYAPQSMTIQGILGDMYKTFSTELESGTNAEAASNRNFEAFIATKEAEHATMTEALQKKDTQKAEAEVMLAEALQEYDVTEEQMKADIEFFDATKSACTTKSDEWKTRSELRTEELAGIEEALKILTSDAARELFGKAIKPGVATGFLQSAAVPHSASRVPALGAATHAYSALKAHAAGAHSLRLAKLAVAISTAAVGHFDKVITAIDTMVQTLKDEETSDIAKRDQCTHEYQQINRTIADVSWKIKVNEAKISKHEALIQKKEADKAATIEEIARVAEDIKTMNEQRTSENQAFLAAKKDDEDAIALLTQAKDALSAYFEKNDVKLGQIQGLLQEPEFEVSKDQAPEATFSGKGHRKGESKGIISILANVIEDLGGEIRVATQDEASTQLAFEKALAAAEKLSEELQGKVVVLEGFVAEQQVQKTDETTLKTGNEANKTSTTEYQTKIQPDCDWIIGGFGERATKRAAEHEGLTQAKEFLAGYQVQTETLVQQGTQHPPSLVRTSLHSVAATMRS